MATFQPLLPIKVPVAPRIDSDFDEAFANEIAKAEAYNKHHYRPNTYLHKWWARRCGSTFRLILKALVDNELSQDYYAAGGLEGKLILDPMMGGGTTLHEAIRMGANVVGADIDPIPILQARATLSKVGLDELEAAFAQLYDAVSAELAPHYTTICEKCGNAVPIRYMLYGQKRISDDGAALFIDSLTLRRQNNGPTISICPDTHNILQNGEVLSESISDEKLPFVFGRARTTKANQKYAMDIATPFYQRFRPIAIVGHCPTHDRFFQAPQQADLDQLAILETLRPQFDPANFTVADGPKTKHLRKRGINHYTDLFSTRQLLYLEVAKEVLQTFEPTTQLNLALLTSTSLEFNSMLCGYKGQDARSAGAIRHTFSYHAYSFPHTALENNPLFRGHKASGTLTNLFHRRLRRGREWAAVPLERVPAKKKWRKMIGEIDQGDEVTSLPDPSKNRQFYLQHTSATDLDLPADSIDHVVTDPPYFDSVQYSDLATFFQVWLRQLVPNAAGWDVALAGTAVHQHASNNDQYATVLTQIFSECHRVLRKEEGRLVFSFHHWKPKAWSSLTIALKQAGFILVNHYTVHAENPISVHVNNLNSLLHDTILVCASGQTTQSPAWIAPATPNKEDSATFLQDATALLGHLLTTNHDNATIHQLWRDFLR